MYLSKIKTFSRKQNHGFTLIELLVVVAIIALLSSVALIAFISARQKSRDVKRLSDMTQMNTALELFYSANKGYPAGIGGIPQGMTPTAVGIIPTAPITPDGICDGLTHSADSCVMGDAACNGVPQNTYYYVATGTMYNLGGPDLYPDYNYFFCLGKNTANFEAGPRIITPKGIR